MTREDGDAGSAMMITEMMTIARTMGITETIKEYRRDDERVAQGQ